MYKLRKGVEIWKDIPNYEGMYQCSNLGRIKSLPRIISNNLRSYLSKEIIRKPNLGYRGYFRIVLHKDGINKDYAIHQLVAMAFLNHSPNGHNVVVDHINNDKIDNRLSNLQLISHRENGSKDKFRLNKSSKYVGVSFENCTKKWKAVICINKKNKSLGRFKTEIEAHEAYQKALLNLKQ